MKSKQAPSPPAVRALLSLSAAISGGIQPLQWWHMEIAVLPSEVRRTLLSELASLLAHHMRGTSDFAQSLNVDKTKNPYVFDSVLFDFLLPLHSALVQQGAWDEALNLEINVYMFFIKQDEDSDFYQRAFAGLYAPYSDSLGLVSNSTDSSRISATDSINPPVDATLFWFQNYSILAHTQVVLDLASHLPIPAKLYASALTNSSLEQSQSIFSQAGIEILKLDDRLSISAKCSTLIKLCKNLGISNIVLVSLPLQSGYFKQLSNAFPLTWWSMKYPLGCMPHFDRLVCNRTIYPTQKIFHGAIWQCAPFALKALSPHPAPHPLAGCITNLNAGVLSRVEKFASSQLPEILNQSLSDMPNFHLYWTGRSEDPDLAARLHGNDDNAVHTQVHFSGWVDPALFLTQIDLLVDTPNLGGIVAYWAMSMGKVVVSATDSGSIGALGAQHELKAHFKLLISTDDVYEYFAGESNQAYYLSSIDLIPVCLKSYANNKALLEIHGQRFLRVFSDLLSNMDRFSEMTYLMLRGLAPK
jgi:hypothetical protein